MHLNVDSALVIHAQSTFRSLDSDAASMDGSPAHKRARYDLPAREHWSLVQRGVHLDDVIDSGVAVLEESDSEGQTDDERLYEKGPLKSDCNDNTKDYNQQVVSNISLQELDGYLKVKPHSPLNYSTVDQFSILSDEIVLHIFHFLPKKQLIELACVCPRFSRLTKDESLWTRMDCAHRVLRPGALGQMISRQVIILRLAQSEVNGPAILPDCRAADVDFESRLLYLDLSMVHISTDDLHQLFMRCRRLKKLSLEHVPVNDDVLTAIARNKELEVLNLAMAEGIELPGAKKLLSSCLKLRELNLAWTFMSNTVVKYICSNLPKSLDRLNMSGCRKAINDNNVLALVTSCTGLRELDLSDCTGLTGDVINYITTLEGLNFLALSRCYLIPYKCMIGLSHIKSLTYLDLHGGYIDSNELKVIGDALGSHVHLNKFRFSSVARPTVGTKKSSIWNFRVRD